MLFLNRLSPHFSSKQLTHHVLALCLGTVGLVSTPLVWADAEVSVPENVIVLGIDGQETGNTGFFGTKHTNYRLPAGEHTITARYDRLFPLGEDHDVVRSKGVTIRTVLADQQVYTLGWQPEPDTHEEALAFVKQPTLIIKAANGQVIAAQKGLKMQSTSVIASVMQGVNNLTTNSSTPAATTLDRLQTLWDQATTEQRKQFKTWIDQQANK